MTFARLLAAQFALLCIFPLVCSAQGPLTNGNTHTGSIATALQVHAWTFQAKAGDSLSMNIGEVSEAKAPFFPAMRLMSPTGTQLQWATGDLASQIRIVAPATGTYTVLVSSSTFTNNNTGLGTYRITLANTPAVFTVPAGDEGGPLVNGTSQTGTITLGDLDLWSFQANAGSSLSVSIAEVGAVASPFYPWIRLRRPDGVELGNATGDLISQINATAPATGTYTVVVGSATFTNVYTGTGTYRLTLANAPGPVTISGDDEGGPMTNGANHTGSIPLGDLDMWTFQANAGEAITIGIGETKQDTANFFPWIRLRSPTGAQLGTSSGDLAGQIIATATATGTYTVVVGSSTSNGYAGGTGSYRLTLAKVPGAYTISSGDEGGELTNGANHAGAIPYGDLDMWSFQANAGDAISVSIGETKQTTDFFYPYIRLRSPSGTQLKYALDDKATQITVAAPATGIYTVLVSSSTSNSYIGGTGEYQLTLALTPGTFVVSSGDEGGPMMRGANHEGRIHLGDLDMWTFNARAGQTVTITITETGETTAPFFPWIRLRRPNGVLGAEAYGDKTATIRAVIPTTGIYTVVAGTTTPIGYTAGAGNYRIVSSHGGLSYSALGDSFSSGEGVVPYSDTGNLLSGCHRSLLAYSKFIRTPDIAIPFSLRPDTELDFFACSGAEVKNVTPTGEGQHGEPPQLAAVNQINETRDLVTISIGGNDSLFIPLVEYCLIHAHCHDLKPFDPHSSAEVQDLFPGWVAVVKARLIALYSEIRRATPNAATVVVGYPILLSGRECSAVQVPGFDDLKLSEEEQVFMRKANEQLNTAVVEAAAAVGLHFVSVAERFAGHEICGTEDDWINGLVPYNPKASFHPTVRGQFEYSQAINAYLESKKTGWAFGYLPSGLPRNPNPGAVAPATAAPIPTIGRPDVRVTSTPAGCSATSGIVVPGGTVAVQGSGFASSEVVRLSLMLADQQMLLGGASADAMGVLNATITIPLTVPVGSVGTIEAVGAGATARGHMLLSLVRVVGSVAETCGTSSVPTLTTLAPVSTARGRTLTVTLTGTDFRYPIQVGAGADITIDSVVVTSPVSATATFTLSPTATIGSRNVTVSTAGGTSNSIVFTITP